jgi:AcrR family transcriptional regulator
MARAGRKRGGQEQPRATRAALIEATVAALADQGFSATSARAVAVRAGVAPGGVFYHFGSMDELLAEVFTTCLDRRIARLRGALAAPAAGLPAAFAEAVRHEFAHPESRALLELVVGAITSPLLGDRVREGLDRSFGFTREMLAQVLAGSPLASVVPLDLMAQVVASAFFGLAVMDLVGADVDIDGMSVLANMLIELTATGDGR